MAFNKKYAGLPDLVGPFLLIFIDYPTDRELGPFPRYL